MSITDRVAREKEAHNQGIERKKYKDTLSHIRYYWNQHRIDFIKDYFGPCLDEPILELGSSIWYQWLERNGIEAKDVTCINISETDLRKGEQKLEGPCAMRPKFYVMDAHKTEFEDNSFNMVFGAGILHHLDLEVALKEIDRILVPGGRFFFLEPLDINPVSTLIRLMTPNARTPDEVPFRLKQIRQTKAILDANFDCQALANVATGIASRAMFSSADNWVNKSGFNIDQALCNIPYFKFLSREMIVYRKVK